MMSHTISRSAGSHRRPTAFALVLVVAPICFLACESVVADPVHLGSPAVCGDWQCEASESPASCPDDCGTCGSGTCDPNESELACPEDCYCGNGTCNGSERPWSCPNDCYCGNGTCDVSEWLADCPEDCATCGDGLCSANESYLSCATDCQVCGDGHCSSDEAAWSCPDDCTKCGDHWCDDTESPSSCEEDCPCGDGICESFESPGTCATDCWCGNGLCDLTETVTACPADCHCGNGTCDDGEDAAICPEDCYCGDGACNDDEDQLTCPADCRAVSIVQAPRPTSCCDCTDNPTTCVILADTTLRCWAGYPGAEYPYPSYEAPMRVPGLRGVAQVELGGDDCSPSVLVVLADGSLARWTPLAAHAPVALWPHVRAFVQAGFERAVRGDGTLWEIHPTAADDGANLHHRAWPAGVTRMDPRGSDFCTANTDGRVYCQGVNLPDLDSHTGADAVAVPGALDAVAIAHAKETLPSGGDPPCTGAANRCALSNGGALVCWGVGFECSGAIVPCAACSVTESWEPHEFQCAYDIRMLVDRGTRIGLIAVDDRLWELDGSLGTRLVDTPGPILDATQDCVITTDGAAWCNYGLWVRVGPW